MEQTLLSTFMEHLELKATPLMFNIDPPPVPLLEQIIDFTFSSFPPIVLYSNCVIFGKLLKSVVYIKLF